MFERIFQDYEGYAEELTGLKVSCLKALIDQANNDDTILIWIGVNDNSNWYRIFIDGYYCGIDCYKTDLSNDDLDDDVIYVDYNCINDEIIVSTKVESGNVNLGYSSILLTIEFLSGKKLLLFCLDSDGVCKLEIVPFNL